jgi:23S rRNA (cytidine2498-2'-O)-methyltransferase
MPTSIIFTAQPIAADLALNELRSADHTLRLERWLDDGVGLARTASAWGDLVALLSEHPPVFVRHLCPATAHIDLERAPDDIEFLAYEARGFLSELDTVRPYSVQTRTLGAGRWPYSRFDINNRLAAVLGEWGAPLDVRQPEQVLSVVLTPTEAFLGLSFVYENQSDWAGGERRFKREAEQVSRSEFKLLEALETFDLELPAAGLALDMGAAPGGWTRLLATHGLRVIAVDPAELDPRVAALPNVTHIRTTIENYLSQRETFDVIVNDMRMDARDSARVMLSAVKLLKPKGFAVMTLKLPEKGMGDVLGQALQLLGIRYRRLGARQLFHNRDEVTVALAGTGT